MHAPAAAPAILELRGICKAFGPVQALDQVDLEVRAGEVHALIGENGAGKSTLMKILYGACRPDAGAMRFRGRPHEVNSPAQGRRAGIAMIHQELLLAPHLTVEENMTLGLERRAGPFLRRERARVRELLAGMGHADLDPDRPVRTLSINVRQVVEIARALLRDARLILMDEPTSSLSGTDKQALFRVVRRLRERGVSVIYITHFIEEVMEVADRFTVLRDGRSVAAGRVREAAVADLVRCMVGRSLREMYPRRAHAVGEAVLRVRDLHGVRGPAGASFALRRGEILGIAGLVGAGRSETVRGLFGLEPVRRGAVRIRGRPEIRVSTLSPSRALDRGLDLLSENRQEEGLAPAMSIAANLTLSGLPRYRRAGVLRLRAERRAAQGWCRRLGIRFRDVDHPVAALSGGNQQKVALARLLHHDSEILFLDEPTRGIDVGSKAEIYRLIQELAAQGKALVVVSSYLPELLGICDSIAVMHRGRMSETRAADAWTEEQIMLFAASGGTGAGTAPAAARAEP